MENYNKEEFEDLLKTMKEFGSKIVIATQPPRQSRHYYNNPITQPVCPICIIDHIGLLKLNNNGKEN